MYRKPSFRPHFLSSPSGHPTSHKSTIFTEGAHRALSCCSAKARYDACTERFVQFRTLPGYRVTQVPPFCADKRREIIASAARRATPSHEICPGYQNGQCIVSSRAIAAPPQQVSLHSRSRLFMVLQFTEQTKLALSSFRQHVGSCIPVHINTAWSVCASTFQVLGHLTHCEAECNAWDQSRWVCVRLKTVHLACWQSLHRPSQIF